MQTTMAQTLSQSIARQNVQVVPVEPHVKSAKTRELLNAGVSGNSKTGKSADPSCYHSVTVEIRTGLFDIVERDMNLKQMEKFVKIRNKSGFNNNLQFSIDMRECGIDPKELENCTNLNDRIGYWWDTPVGVLVELHGQLTLYKAGTIVDMTTGKPFYAKPVIAA